MNAGLKHHTIDFRTEQKRKRITMIMMITSCDFEDLYEMTNKSQIRKGSLKKRHKSES
ncbi:hypothetical protein Hanom_Chr14g01285011 [Helianthus anomalus]